MPIDIDGLTGCYYERIEKTTFFGNFRWHFPICRYCNEYGRKRWEFIHLFRNRNMVCFCCVLWNCSSTPDYGILVGLIVMHTGILLILKGEFIYPTEFGFITFVCGILVLLNSGFSEYMKERKNKR